MSAFNWIEFIAKCPVCLVSTGIRAQSHIAASFEADDQGRFCQQVYQVGDTMRWWSKDDKRHARWETGGVTIHGDKSSVRECCYANCVAHGDEIYAVLEFSNLTIRKVIELGPLDRWPAGYPK
jgi:hypothetical protein